MSPRFKTPTRTATSAPRHENSTGSYAGSIPAHNSTVERSPTLVGDSPPPRLSKVASPLSSRAPPNRILLSSNATSPHTPLKSAPITPSTSTRKKPVCRTCGELMKGHKRGQCHTPLPNESKSLYASSPENERTPTKAPPRPLRTIVEPSTSSISALSSTTSASGKRRPPHCRKCNEPMKGHKRQLGMVVCPVDTDKLSVTNEDGHKLLSTLSSGRKGPKGLNEELPANRSKDARTRAPASKHLPTASAAASASSEFPMDEESSFNQIPDNPSDSSHQHQPHAPSASSSARASHRSSNARTNPLPRAPSASCQTSQESLLSSDSYNSISDYAPIASASQYEGVQPSFDALYHALGEPEVAIYIARNREVLKQIRNKAKDLRYFSGVVDATKLPGEFDMTRALTMGGARGLMKEEESSAYRKLILLSENEEMVRKCIDLFKGLLLHS